MKIIANIKANALLNSLGVEINELNRLAIKPSKKVKTLRFLNELENSLHIPYFSQYIVGWLSDGQTNWKLLKVDDCTSGYIDERVLLGSLLSPIGLSEKDFFSLLLRQAYAENLQQDAYYFEHKNSLLERYFYDIKLAQVIGYLISYEQHGYILSSRENYFRMISIQDGEITLYVMESDASALDQFMLGVREGDYTKFREWVWEERVVEHRLT